MNTYRAWLERLVLAVLGAFIGGGAVIVIGLISFQVQFGHINIINGDQNKVDNGSQIQTVIQPKESQPIKATPQQPVSEPAPITTPVQEESITPTTRSHASYVGGRNAPIQYESEDDCTCPDEEGEEAQSLPEVRTYTPQTIYVNSPPMAVLPSYQSQTPMVVLPNSQYQNQTITNDGYSQSQVQTTSNGVTVRTSTGGANSHARVVINGKVVVDQ